MVLRVPAADAASFRDPTNAVFYRNGTVLRGLSGDSIDNWTALAKTAFFARRIADRSLVATAAAAADVGGAEIGSGLDVAWPVVLEHERIPFVTYPYEWTFGQLRDAALLHLDLLRDALGEGMTMKDGYAYNVQWRGARPVFIDIPSFERSTGGPWAGYKQFCQTFLFPLLLQAHRGMPFRPLLRGQVNGIEPRQIATLLGARDVLRPGVLKHVMLHSAMDARFAAAGHGARATREELTKAGFSTELTKAMAASLRKLVAKLSWRAGDSPWKSYQSTSTYTGEEQAAKGAFVDAALAGWAPLGSVWDLGCNDGTYSRVAARHAAYVVAVDGDEPTVDSLYRALRAEASEAILPLVMDLTDPSPAIGWRNRERAAFFDRGSPDAVLCLALVHHLAITANVPLPAVLDWLHAFTPRLVIEFVAPTDPMATRLLANKPAGMFPDYTADAFERLLAERFDLERRLPLPSGTRTLYAVRRRG